MIGQFVGPHDADTQQGADHLDGLCADKSVQALDVAARMVAEDVLERRDPWTNASLFDALERDVRWAIHRLLVELAAH